MSAVSFYSDAANDWRWPQGDEPPSLGFGIEVRENELNAR